ncbi:Cell adhesion molecule DSCAM [Dirofilaria immitis]
MWDATQRTACKPFQLAIGIGDITIVLFDFWSLCVCLLAGIGLFLDTETFISDEEHNVFPALLVSNDEGTCSVYQGMEYVIMA